MAKLTKPQQALLDELPTSCSESYPPAIKLVELGLARWERGTFGDRLVPATPSDKEGGE